MSTHAERLQSVINKLNLNARSFAIELGYTRADTIYAIFKRNSKISNSLLNKICNRFPQVNREWLMTGFGSMFTKHQYEPNRAQSMSTPAQRIDLLINTLNLNVNAFSKECGYPTSATIWRLIKEGAKPSYPTLNKICNRFPQVNREWLMTGYGSMFKKKHDDDLTITAKQVIDYLQENTEDLKKELSDLNQQLVHIRSSLIDLEVFHGIDIEEKYYKNI